ACHGDTAVARVVTLIRWTRQQPPPNLVIRPITPTSQLHTTTGSQASIRIAGTLEAPFLNHRASPLGRASALVTCVTNTGMRRLRLVTTPEGDVQTNAVATGTTS